MRILILGAGEVGSYLAKTLKQYRHEVIVIDTNSERLERLASQTDIIPIVGSGTSFQTLKDAGFSEVEIFIAVTAVDEVNILACSIANQFRIPHKIARVRNKEYSSMSPFDLLHRFGIDIMVNPEMTAAKEIANLLKNNHAVEYQEFSEGKLKFIGSRVTTGASIVGRTIRDLMDPQKNLPFFIQVIQRSHQTMFCNSDTVIESEDVVYATVLENGTERFYSACGHESERVRDVMMYGASEVGEQTAKEIENDKRIRIKIVEPISERAHIVAKNLPKALVMQGEGTDIDLLASEGLGQMNAFVACTDNDEKNIVSCLLARHLGVNRVVTLIGRSEYLPIFRTIGLDIPINLRQLTANSILHILQQGSIISTKSIRGIDCVAYLFECYTSARITGKQISELQFSENARVAAIIRKNQVEFPKPETVIESSDKVFILAKSSALNTLFKLFR